MIERAQIRVEDRIGGIDDPARVAEDASYAALLWDAADAPELGRAAGPDRRSSRNRST